VKTDRFKKYTVGKSTTLTVKDVTVSFSCYCDFSSFAGDHAFFRRSLFEAAMAFWFV